MKQQDYSIPAEDRIPAGEVVRLTREEYRKLLRFHLGRGQHLKAEVEAAFGPDATNALGQKIGPQKFRNWFLTEDAAEFIRALRRRGPMRRERSNER